MMILEMVFRVKQLRDVSAGDLLSIKVGGHPVLAVKLSQEDERGDSFLLVLKSPHNLRHPFWCTESKDKFVLTYGGNWVLDIGLAEHAVPGEYGSTSDTGSIVIENGIAFLRAGSINQNTSLGNKIVKLQDFTFADTPYSSTAIFVENWKIWLSVEEQNKHGGLPLIISGPQHAI